MTELMALEFDALTGKEIFRPLTPAEITNREAMRIEQEALQAEQDAKIAARQSALAKLAALGLTEEEIGAL
jgi:hypothetical protein